MISYPFFSSPSSGNTGFKRKQKASLSQKPPKLLFNFQSHKNDMNSTENNSLN
ncbi:hypothetical protein SPPR111872_04550 [Sphingobacterium prati]